jgi:uncharacterized protein
MLIAVTSDTHLRGADRLPEACRRILRHTDLVLHAGDISTVAALDDLRAIGPEVIAVAGNVDEPALVERLPAAIERDVEGVILAMTHDAGRSAGRLERMRRRFPQAAAVVFGHSHMPLLEVAEDGFQIFNPGSPTVRRRTPEHTIGLAHIAAGRLRFVHIVV